LDASIHILTYRASIGEILVQWRRLYASHREGLFHFLADPRIPSFEPFSLKLLQKQGTKISLRKHEKKQDYFVT